MLADPSEAAQLRIISTQQSLPPTSEKVRVTLRQEAVRQGPLHAATRREAGTRPKLLSTRAPALWSTMRCMCASGTASGNRNPAESGAHSGALHSWLRNTACAAGDQTPAQMTGTSRDGGPCEPASGKGQRACEADSDSTCSSSQACTIGQASVGQKHCPQLLLSADLSALLPDPGSTASSCAWWREALKC